MYHTHTGSRETDGFDSAEASRAGRIVGGGDRGLSAGRGYSGPTTRSPTGRRSRASRFRPEGAFGFGPLWVRRAKEEEGGKSGGSEPTAPGGSWSGGPSRLPAAAAGVGRSRLPSSPSGSSVGRRSLGGSFLIVPEGRSGNG